MAFDNQDLPLSCLSSIDKLNQIDSSSFFFLNDYLSNDGSLKSVQDCLNALFDDAQCHNLIKTMLRLIDS